MGGHHWPFQAGQVLACYAEKLREADGRQIHRPVTGRSAPAEQN